MVSVIIPIYKVEKYLRKCVDSVIEQTYSNLEIILVDDGSPDSCPDICDEYSKIDKRIKVIHKENGGLSEARNFGVDIAKGKYITFIDSDDYVSNDYVEYMMNLLLKYDGDMCSIMPYRIYEDNPQEFVECKEKIDLYDRIDALTIMLYQKKFGNSAWGKLYKRELVENVSFPVGKLYEDLGTTYKYILNCTNKIIVSNQHKYFYLQRKGSIMSSSYKVNDKDYFYQAEKLLNDVSKYNNYKLTKAAICRYVNANFSVLLKIKKNKKYINDRLEIISNIKKYSIGVLFDVNSRIKTKVAILLLFFNII